MTNLLLVGGYTPPMGTGRGITLLEYVGGELADLGLVALTESPSFLIARDEIVYVVNEAEQGRVTSFRWTDRQLQHLVVQNTGGAHPCHLAIDPGGTVLASANYTSGSVSLHRIDPAGGIEPFATLLQHAGNGPISDRQDGAHAHQVVFANDVMFVVDLGSDRVWRYRFDPAAITVEPLEPLVLPAGFGPRQVVLDGRYAYVLGELSNQLAILDETEIVSLVPAYGAPLAAGNLAATLLQPVPGRLIVSHRGADRICVFDASARDSVELVAEFSSEGAWPRHLAVDEDRLVIADQLSDAVIVRSPDGSTAAAAVPNPTCILPMG